MAKAFILIGKAYFFEGANSLHLALLDRAGRQLPPASTRLSLALSREVHLPDQIGFYCVEFTLKTISEPSEIVTDNGLRSDNRGFLPLTCRVTPNLARYGRNARDDQRPLNAVITAHPRCYTFLPQRPQQRKPQIDPGPFGPATIAAVHPRSYQVII